MSKNPAHKKMIARNRRATFDYDIIERLEAGIVLSGSEIKSIRENNVSLNESYAGSMAGSQDVYLFNVFIPEYKQATYNNHEPRQPRKLLLHRRQINKWLGAVRKKGLTLVPLSLYFNEKNRIKVEIGLGKGKKKADKRESIKERDWKREKARVLKVNNQ